jgi:hypothetical protein
VLLYNDDKRIERFIKNRIHNLCMDTANKKIEKERYQITLDKPLVEEAKKIQIQLAKAENLSGLLNALLSDWVENIKGYLKHQKTFDEVMAEKIKKEGVQK